MKKAWDYIVVGSGAAGCIVAEQLSRDPSRRVLLLEAGARRRTPLLDIPAAETLLLGNSHFDWCFQTQPDPTLGGRRLSIPRGRVVGGSAAINGMIYVRGQAADFEDWVSLGCQGWGWSDVMPFYQRLESSAIAGPTRGSSGRIHVGRPRTRHQLADAFIHAGVSLGYSLNSDYNSDGQEGFGYYQVNHRRGRRSAPSNTYLIEAMRRDNLTLLTGALVDSVVLADGAARGIRCRLGNRIETIDCEGEVVLSAGAIQSPRILELSGIGSPDLLRNAGITVRHELPGVGENLQDHYAVRMRWRVKNPVTFNDDAHGVRLAREIIKYLTQRRGMLSVPIALAHAFIGIDDKSRPDVQYHFSPASYGAARTRRLDHQPGMTIGAYPLRPKARGSVHVASADPRQAPIIHTRFLQSQNDLRLLIESMKVARALIADNAFDEFRGLETQPGESLRTDDDLARYAREQGDTSYHPVGTCKMGVDPFAVVDTRLCVRGLQRLRVIDASVMPVIVSGNTNAASMMIGEKGADLVASSRPSSETRLGAEE
ncbi:GMC family oxidoreductase [Mycobacterium gordonae]|uniref:GMC family oxidoreductase n=1 Tax=Mycobacterium gordonae TaxID=1778 RepID=UPI0009EA33EB|nr:GMC family oxidoreductase N-terminal domain-containing protein [Mycobacterium gordonae]